MPVPPTPKGPLRPETLLATGLGGLSETNTKPLNAEEPKPWFLDMSSSQYSDGHGGRVDFRTQYGTKYPIVMEGTIGVADISSPAELAALQAETGQCFTEPDLDGHIFPRRIMVGYTIVPNTRTFTSLTIKRGTDLWLEIENTNPQDYIRLTVAEGDPVTVNGFAVFCYNPAWVGGTFPDYPWENAGSNRGDYFPGPVNLTGGAYINGGGDSHLFLPLVYAPTNLNGVCSTGQTFSFGQPDWPDPPGDDMVFFAEGLVFGSPNNATQWNEVEFFPLVWPYSFTPFTTPITQNVSNILAYDGQLINNSENVTMLWLGKQPKDVPKCYWQVTLGFGSSTAYARNGEVPFDPVDYGLFRVK